MEERLLRRQDETDEQYQIRLTLMKQNGVDIDWSEIAELVGDGRSSEAFRKDSYGIRRYHNSIDKANDNEILLEIKKERNKLNDLRNLVNKQTRKLSKVEDFADIIIDECRNMDGFILPDIKNKPQVNDGIDSILDLSDIHFDGSDKPCENIIKLIYEVIPLCELHKVNRLTVFINGDIINGDLKSTISRENREATGKQLVGVSKILSDALIKLAEKVPYVCVGINTGNHDRSIEDYKKALTTDNYLPVIKEIMKLRLENISNIIMIDNYVDDRFTLCKIKNKTHVAYHGNGLKNLEKDSIRTIEGFLDVKVDYLHLGHFHSPKEVMNYDSKIIINGSLYNGSDYGKKLLLRTPEIQKLMMLDEVGDIKCCYDIRL